MKQMNRAMYPAVGVVFALIYAFTSPEYIGDTVRYASDVVQHAEGRRSQFWEFGHLLWRPWGYVGHTLLGSAYSRWFGDTPVQAVARFFIHTNLLCSAAVLLLVASTVRRFTSVGMAVVTSVVLATTIPFINYSHSGAPYVAALFLCALALRFLLAAKDRPANGQVYVALGGIAFALACSLWFPYSFVGLGLLVAVFYWSPPGQERIRTAIFLGGLGVSVFLLFGSGAAARGVTSAKDLAQWIAESDNGWAQSRTAVRAVTGLARSMWSLGDDPVLLKRWLFSDPYNPVRLSTIVFGLGSKLVLFYLGVAATAWILWRRDRITFSIAAAAAVPLVLFAILLFEPSSPERFLPLFPFTFLAFAVALHRAWKAQTYWAVACIAALLGCVTLHNLSVNAGTSTTGRFDETLRRTRILSENVRPGALVAVVTFQDDLYRLPDLNPLNKELDREHHRVTDVIEVASKDAGEWRAVFARKVRDQWAAGGEVWISERLLATQPRPEWLWVEGDDQRVRWSDIPAVFRQLRTDSRLSVGQDGFLRLRPDEVNASLLAGRPMDAAALKK